jgi:xylan 1,4-beta-xylosidase
MTIRFAWNPTANIRWYAVFVVAASFIAGAAWAAEPAVVVSVDARRDLGENDRFWASAVFHPTELLDTDWGKEHLDLLRDGGVTLKYVRIYNQPEDAAYIKDDGSVGYRWDHFDRRADMILARGLKLIVAFFSMPEPLLADPKTFSRRPFLDGKKIFIGPPKDYRAWQAMCADFTRHVVERYGEDRAAQWRFTCWNEPDLYSFWHKSDMDAYEKLYDHFAEGVRSVSKRIPIGGPALSSSNTFLHPEHFRDFLKHVATGTNHATGRRGSPIDYIPMHTYGGRGGGGSVVCPYPSVDYLLEQQKRLVAMRDEFPELRDVPILIQEWGVSASGALGMDKQPLAETRNTNYDAAFLAAMAARQLDWRRADNPRLGDMLICLSGYHKARTRDFEGKRTVQTLHGFDKPLLNGYRALAKLGPEWVACQVEPAADHLTVLASRDNDRRIAVAVTHFRNDKPKSDGPAQPVLIKLTTPWADGTPVEIRHWRIDGSHSNAYAVYCQLGRPENPTAEQTQRIKSRMGLEPLAPPRRTTIRGVLEIPLDLPCNAISLIEVIHEEGKATNPTD